MQKALCNRLPGRRKVMIKLLETVETKLPDESSQNLSYRERLSTISPQIWKVMKLTTILLFAAFMHAAATGDGQTISVKAKKAPLTDVFKQIEQQTQYTFFYKMDVLSAGKPVTLKLENVQVETALRQCFAGQPLTYSIEGKIITVKQAAPEIKNEEEKAVQQLPPPINISGKVTDEDGKPLVGASVAVKGKGKGTTTNNDGVFTLNGLSAEDVITISYTGYLSQSLNLGDRTSFIVKLKVNDNPLDQVVVRAYDQTSRRLNTGNIETVTAKQIENQPVTNPLIALQGQVPGLIINQASGFSNSGVTVQIQGPNSLLYNNLPFYVVDGVPYPTQNLPGLVSVLGVSGNGAASYKNNYGARSGNPLSFLNPLDIESISILKDADATAIYGSQAANGAIIITTKKGKAGINKVSLNFQHGIAEDKRFMNLMNRAQYMKMRNDAFYGADGLDVNSPRFGSAYDLNGTWDTTRETNWQREFLGGTAKLTNLQASISGGDSKDNYRISVNYNRQTMIFPTDFTDQKGSFHMNFNHSSANGRFKAQTSVEYMLDNNQLPGFDLTATAYSLIPVAPALYKPDGTLNWEPNANGIATWYNPLALLKIKHLNKTGNLVGSLNLSGEIFKDLIFSSNFGFNEMQQDEIETTPTTSMPPEYSTLYGIRPSSQFSNGSQRSWIVEPRLTYKKVIGLSRLETFIGATYRKTNLNFQSFNAENYTSDLLLEDIRSAGAISVNNTTISEYRYGALFGHLGYNFDEKYILSFNARRDGSSRFGTNNLFNDFWSAAGAFIFSKTKLFTEHLSWLSFGKLKISYGTTGSDGIGDYASLNVYSTSGGTYNTYQGVPTYFGGLSNPNLQWEETHKLNLGISLGFLNDRILVEANYYRNRSSNQLLSYELPPTTGAGSLLQNFPATIQNSGLEFLLTTKPIQSKKFDWSSVFNLSFNRNKLVSFPTLATSSYANSYIVGQPIDINPYYRYAGVNQQTGLYQFYKADGTITYYPAYPADAVPVSLLPKFIGGWSNQLVYKRFSLDVLFQFASQMKANSLMIGSGIPGGMKNQQASLNYWTQSHTSSSVQRLTSGADGNTQNQWYNANNSDFVINNGSYIRLKNLALSYQLPSEWSKKVGMTDSRILVSGQNLLTLTKYKGLDPESGNGGLPPLRVITLSVQANF